MRKTVIQAWIITNEDATKFIAQDRSTGPMSTGGYPYISERFTDDAVFTSRLAVEQFFDMFTKRDNPGFKIVPFEGTVQI
jgi:hypothetical protein